MSDLRPPEPGATPSEGPGADDVPPEGTPPPAVPPIDLSAPEAEAPEPAVSLAKDLGAQESGAPEAPASPPLAAPPESTTPPPSPATPAATVADGAGSGGPNLKLLVAIMAVVTVALLGAVIYLLTKSDDNKVATTPTSTSSTTVNTTPVDTADWVTDTDEASGFTIKRPKDWISTGQASGQNRLLLSAGEQNFLLVTARNVDPSTVADEIEQAMADLEIIEGPKDLDISGLPAVLYIYKTPITEENREEGVIVHYFIVRGSKMYSLIFQARPKDELNRLARVFNAVTTSFQSTSDAPAPDPLPTTTDTTVAGTTSTTR